MPLPGKLTIGFLQEDNPVKFYFRFKPLYTQETEGYEAASSEPDLFPDDGFIRIVPDKNELTQFKSRMRGLGRYCALDLRKYAGENEKIRPNKNYGSSSERNAYIVYSDAVGEIPEGMVMEVLDAGYVFLGEEITLRAARPGTPLALVRREGTVSGPWRWTEAADVVGCISLTHACGEGFVSVPEADLACLTLSLGEGSAVLATNLAPFEEGIAAAKAQMPAPADAPLAPTAPEARLETAPEDAQSDAPKPEPAPQVACEPQLEAEAQPRPVVKSEPPLKNPAPAPEPPKAEPEKPWIQKTEMPRPRAISGRLSLREQTLQAQMGINPAKGRSLSEVVDEQWRKSRYDQLGCPVPPDATGRPVISPIERAVTEVCEAWRLENARKGLIEGLLSNEELRGALAECLKINIEKNADGAPDAHADELEARRLQLVNEIDALRIRRNDMKAALMEELRRAHKQEFDGYQEKNRAMMLEAERNEKAAQSARMAAEAAGELLSKTSEQIEQQLLGHLMTERAIELVMHVNDRRPATLAHPETYDPSAGELITDLRVQLESAGFTLDNDDAVNLLACMLTGGMAIVSGASGSGKSQLVRQLAAALGLTGSASRFVEARSPEDPAIESLLTDSDSLTPYMVLLDDVNLAENDDAVNGAIRLQEEALAKGIPLCLMLTVQDAPDGRPLSARLLTRAFFIRLDPASAASGWKPPKLLPASPEKAVSLCALRAILEPSEELPGEVEERLRKLRQQLDAVGYFIDRRTLNELWRYCASVERAGRLSGLEALDRALAQRAVPAMLAAMNLDQLTALPGILCDLPRCMKLLEQPLPLPPL